MYYFLYGLFFVSCIALVASVLLQPGKTDAGALFTSNISSTAFQPRGSQTILSKITIIAATTFMLSALFLSLPALTGNISVLQTTNEENAPVDTPIIPTDANANVSTDANPTVDANANAVETAPASSETNADTANSNVNQ